MSAIKRATLDRADHAHRVDTRRTGDVVPAPGGMAIGTRILRVDSAYVGSLVITGWPAAVAPGWLSAVSALPGRIDVAVHAVPMAPQIAASHLRRQRARLEATRRLDTTRGRLDDPTAQSAADDATELAYRLARAEANLWRTTVVITAYADSQDTVAEMLERIKAVLGAHLAVASTPTFRAREGWIASLPLGIEPLGISRITDTETVTACLPITSPDHPSTAADGTDGALAGVLYGRGTATGNPVLHDRWSLDNHNMVVLAASGAGKSYLGKLDLLRQLYTGVHAVVIDPDGEYVPIAQAVGAHVIDLGAPGVRLNPLDLPAPTGTDADSEAVLRRTMFAATLIATLAGARLSPDERAAVDQATLLAYERAGITTDIRTHNRRPPLLADVTAALAAAGDPAARRLASRLTPFVSGAHRVLFDGPTTTPISPPLTVVTLHHLPEELTAAGMLTVLDALWRQAITNDGQRRLIHIDEVWTLMRQPDAAGWLYRIAKTARKHHLGLTLITQDATDLLSTDLGASVVANAATTVLLRHAPSSLDQITAALNLSGGERRFLATAPRGHALLRTPTGATTFTALAAPTEHELLRTGLTARETADDDGLGVDLP